MRHAQIVSLFLPNEDATLALGQRLAALLPELFEPKGESALSVHLAGDLGAGKTTFTRGLMRALGWSNTIKSPSYGIVIGYELYDDLAAAQAEGRAASDYGPDWSEVEKKIYCSEVESVVKLQSLLVNHFDLYRVKDPEELEMMGIREYFWERCLCLIEWPYNGEGVLPEPDLTINIIHREDGREVKLVSESLTTAQLNFLAGNN